MGKDDFILSKEKLNLELLRRSKAKKEFDALQKQKKAAKSRTRKENLAKRLKAAGEKLGGSIRSSQARIIRFTTQETIRRSSTAELKKLLKRRTVVQQIEGKRKKRRKPIVQRGFFF